MHADPRTGPHNIIEAQFNSQLNSHLHRALATRSRSRILKSGEKEKSEKIANCLQTQEFVAWVCNRAGVLRVAAWCWSHAVLEPRGALQQLHFSRGREQDIALTQSLTTQRPEAKWE